MCLALLRACQGASGGTTCVWAPVREKHLGPHKMMTYIGRSGGILSQKIFEFKVSEMAFPAFWEHLCVKSKDNKSLFFGSVSIIFKKILSIIGPLIKRQFADNNGLLYCDCLLIVWAWMVPLGPWAPVRCTVCTPVVPPLQGAFHVNLTPKIRQCLSSSSPRLWHVPTYTYPGFWFVAGPC